ncbi:hypothetical protein [Stenomitos frigidus]|uniref:Uncharacterized protein n=1 Tax=Stenomitos frigidus ULC18 TaxID=2107698 RepID=A0A2T1E3F2_9CYAN|nr:hypothetical protein [Stenomitos frigidus]PSB27256.1 hypothetical protein C7B82_17065 [Stenomitos frigidus ULC18]
MTLPLVINESQVRPFKYWQEGIQQGIRYNNDLYAHFQSYSKTERLKAYDIASEQAQKGVSVCMTVSKTHYTIWLSLRSLSHATHGNQLLNKAKALS